ncbi:S41 family peptidase [Brevundimonas sp.]
MSKSSPVIRLTLLALAALSLGACASIPYAKSYEPLAVEQPADGSPERAALNARVYDAAVRYVNRLFYDPNFGGVPFREEARARRAAAIAQPTSEAFHRELKQLLNLLGDGHTYTWSPMRRQRNAERIAGAPYVGYGFFMTEYPAGWVVETVLPGSTASEAGVLPGWRIDSIGGRSVQLAGPAVVGRTDVIVFIDDDGVRQSFSLGGIAMPVRPPFVSRRLDGNIVYLRFDAFSQPQYDSFTAELESFALDAPAGLIIDLRRNEGGSARAMGAMASQLYVGKREQFVMGGRHSMEWFGEPYLGPVVILVGQSSVSAAEIFAAVVQENGRAVVVGQTSYGSTVSPRNIDLADGGVLFVGWLEVTTPGGKRLEGVGVTPDIVVPEDWQAVREGRDPTLEAGIAALQALISERHSMTTSVPEA